MGDNTVSTVYLAEVVGIWQALLQALTTPRSVYRAVIFSDSQAAIQAYADPQNKSGQHYLVQAIRTFEQLRATKGTAAEIHWLPSHAGVPDNEHVNCLAKEAAGWHEGDQMVKDECRAVTIDNLVRSKAATRRLVDDQIKRIWQKSWDTNKAGRILYGVQKQPRKKNLLLYRGMPRLIASIVARARTGAIGLKSFLGAPGLAPIRDCDCGSGTETVKHVVMNCHLYDDLRQEFRGIQPPYDINSDLSETSKVTKIARFLLRTGALGHTGRADKET